MIVPAAMMIETAIDQLHQYSITQSEMLADQRKELCEAVPASSEDFQAGYELGIQTARVLLSGMPAAVFNKVSI